MHGDNISLIQAAVLRHIEMNPERAYGFGISEDVGRALGRTFADAHIYMSLRRLQLRGLIEESNDVASGSVLRSGPVDHCRHLNDPAARTSTRGRPRKYYLVTARGRKALQDAEAGARLLVRGFPERKSHEDNDTPPVPAPVG